MREVATHGVTAGDLVWFADRRNSRTTENLAKVISIRADGTAALSVTVQGVTSTTFGVKPWESNAVMGWWKAKN